MITHNQKRVVLESMLEVLELPVSAYEKAIKRYEDIGEWLGRDESELKENSPHVFSQGSFRLGTAIRPLSKNEEYDLDLVCNLTKGITTETHTQRALKEIVGDELETYRRARGIQKPKQEKHRCWRLDYQDDLSFHMDIVPCIPSRQERKKTIYEAMSNTGTYPNIANEISQLTVSITDDRHYSYAHLCPDWNLSNPEGYAKWFEYRMKQTEALKEARVAASQVDDLPVFKRKTPLQRSIQLLKRHRDQMFAGNEDMKPISIIITTLASQAYNGEADIVSALSGILERMGDYVRESTPRVPNPVNPHEDFADKWATAEGQRLQLERCFWQWLQQAQSDFRHLFSQDNATFIAEQAAQKFSVNINKPDLCGRSGILPVAINTPEAHVISEPAKPWEMI
ncbi:nucleotidyltransferase [Candidatus Dojkabacteria bacterium]|nr:nucleotidyltransferase [Candidatus Dojkabacteria bacterium]